MACSHPLKTKPSYFLVTSVWVTGFQVVLKYKMLHPKHSKKQISRLSLSKDGANPGKQVMMNCMSYAFLFLSNILNS